jgi:hypothetical protein
VNNPTQIADDRREEINAIVKLLGYAWLGNPDRTLSEVIAETLSPKAMRFDQFKELVKRTDAEWVKRLTQVSDRNRLESVKRP